MAEEQNQATKLHQQASAHYLQGEFQEALQSWRDLLALDPQDERALEGVRLCELLADDPPPPTAEEAGDDMDAVDAALRFEAQPRPVEEAAEEFQFDLAHLDTKAADGGPEIPDPGRQADGIDFGDVSSVQTIGLATEPEAAAEPQPAVQAAVATATAPAAEGGHEPSAVTDLARKTTELYAEATAAYQAGDPDQALAVLSRLFVLDETNAPAHALEQRIRAEMEPAVSPQPPPIPGTAPDLDLDGFDLDAAPAAAPVAVAPAAPVAPVAPAAAAAETAAPSDAIDSVPPVEAIDPAVLLDPNGIAADPGTDDAIALDLGGLSEESPSLPQAEAPAEPQARPAPRRPAPVPPATASSPRLPALSGTAGYVAVGVVVAGLLGAAGWFVLPGLIGGAAVPEATENEPTAAAATAGEATEPVAETETAVPKPAAPVLPDRPVAEWLQEAQDAMAAERYDEAVLAYHAVLKTDPGNTTVREQARVAGDLYKEQQEVLARWREARGYFETGRYEQAMKIFYRLPEDDPELLGRYRFNGWYNMGLESLQGGDCLRARKHFREADSIRPDDEVIASVLALCETCRLSQKPAEYVQAIQALQPRTLEQ